MTLANRAAATEQDRETPSPTASAEPLAAETPYRGLAPFSASDYDYFFGRKRDATHIAASTITEALSVLFGPSGVGKSSVLGAALPRALNGIIENTLFVPYFRWEQGFYRTLLARAQARAQAPEGAEIASLEALAEYWIEKHETPVVFVFDQFEQYYLIPAAGARQGDDIDTDFEVDMARVVNRRDLDAHVLISIREDALFELDRLRGRLPNILADPMRLDYIDRAAAEQAIREPLRVFRERHGETAGPIGIDDGLVDELLARARRPADPQHYETPYLQLVLERLWNEERRDGSSALRVATYERLNGWEGIATSHVRHTLETALTEDDRALVAALFDRMVTPSGMKITLAADDLATMVEAKPPQVEAVLTTLGHPDSRIIRSVAPAQDSGERRYEIFHDVLARPILAWKHAFNAEREQRHLREEAEREQERMRVEAEAERVRQQREIDAQTRRATAQRRIAKRFQRISIMATLMAVLALLFAGWAGYSYREAARQRAQVLALRADWATDGGDSRQGLLLALEALPEHAGPIEWLRRPITDEARRALERVLFRPFGRTLSGHDDLTRVAYSPDGTKILTVAEGNQVRILNASSAGGQEVLSVLHHGSPVSAASFSRDGRFIITASQDGKAHIWDAASGAKLTEWEIGAGRRTIVDLSPDNTLIAAIAYGDNATLWSWDPEQRLEPGTLAEKPKMTNGLWDNDGVTHSLGTNFVAFDTTGRRLVTTSWGNEARIWDAETGHLIRTLPRAWGDAQGPCSDPKQGHCEPVVAAAFSPAGPDRVVTASRDRTARVWDLATGRVVATLVGHSKSVTAALFSHDGRRVITAALDGTVRIWNASTGEMLQILKGPAAVAGETASVDIAPDETRVVASFSGTDAYIWNIRDDLEPFVLPRSSEIVPMASLGKNGRRLIAAAGLGVGLYDSTSGRALAAPAYLDGTVMSVMADPKGGDVLAAAGTSVKIFDADAWERGGQPPPPRRLAQHRNLVLSASYDADGKRIVTASQDGTARVWSAATGKPIGLPLRHQGAVFSAMFDRSGRRVLTASFDGTVRIWDVAKSEPLRVINVGAPVLDASFTADDTRLVVTALDASSSTAAPESAPEPPYFRTTTAIWETEAATQADAGERRSLPDNKFLQLSDFVVVGASDGGVNLFSALDSLDEEPLAYLPGTSIRHVAASPGEERLVTVSDAGVIRTWKLPPFDPFALIDYARTIADRDLAPDQRTLSQRERRDFGLIGNDRPLHTALGEWLKATWRSIPHF